MIILYYAAQFYYPFTFLHLDWGDDARNLNSVTSSFVTYL